MPQKLDKVVKPLNSIYLNGIYEPVKDEGVLLNLDVIGKIPENICGSYLRNGPNPRFTPPGSYHWYDGDGMIHCIQIKNSHASYKNAWIRTKGLRAEEEVQRSLWYGAKESHLNSPFLPLKDTSNSSIYIHDSKIITGWHQSGRLQSLEPKSLQSTGSPPFQRTLKIPLSSHGKIDPLTHELIIFSCRHQKPYLNYGVINKEGGLTHWTAIDSPQPSIAHDLGITQKFTILCDITDDFKCRYGIIPRYGNKNQTLWFQGRNGYVNGMTNMILSRIKDLDVTKRPLHCTDLKRETMYIKDNDEWSKDTPDNTQLRNMVKIVAKHNQYQFPLWREKHPSSDDMNSATFKFSLKMIQNILGDVGEEHIKLDNKVMRNLSKHILVDKNV